MREIVVRTVKSVLVIFLLIVGVDQSHIDTEVKSSAEESNAVKREQLPTNQLKSSPPGERQLPLSDTKKENDIILSHCPTGVECFKLGGECIQCTFNNYSCVYGEKITVPCLTHHRCQGSKEFNRTMMCRWCYQTEPWEHTCTQKSGCDSIAAPRQTYRSNCTVKSEVLCFGKRSFPKMLPCNWTGGYKWSTALLLSITLGGFGADRFYLGHWQEGIGKLFSFGGLGVWTLVDVILISIHYLGPADGSLYMW